MTHAAFSGRVVQARRIESVAPRA